MVRRKRIKFANKVSPGTDKKKKLTVEIKPAKGLNICHKIRKDIWIVIFDFIDTKTFFTVIPLVNTYFYDLIQSNKKYLSVFQVCIYEENKKKQLGDDKNDIQSTKLKILSEITQLTNLRVCIMNLNNVPSLSAANNNSKLDICIISMPWASNLKILELGLANFNSSLLKNALNAPTSLEVLKFTILAFFPTGLSYIFSRFVDPNGLPTNSLYFKEIPLKAIPFTPLKELSLAYSHYSLPAIKESDIFPILDRNTSLNSFSLRFIEKLPIVLFVSPAFQINSSLKVLKIPSVYLFTTETAEAFCDYLLRNKVLCCLNISETLTKPLESFLNVLKTCKNLKTLCLNGTAANTEFVLSSENIVKIFDIIPFTCIETLKVYTRSFIIDYNTVQNLSKESIPYYIREKESNKIISSIENMLQTSKTLKKFSLLIDGLPNVSTKRLSKVIVKYAAEGYLEYFNGYNIKSLIYNNTQVLEIKEKEQDFNENDIVLYHIFFSIIPVSKNVYSILRRIKFENKLKKQDSDWKINVDSLINEVLQTKKLIIKNFTGPLHELIAICIGLRVPGIEYLEISGNNIRSYINLLNPILKLFPYLRVFKFCCTLTSNKLQEIQDYVYSALNTLLYIQEIVLKAEFKLSRYEKLFGNIISHKNLKHLKLKKIIMTPVQVLDNNISLNHILLNNKIESLDLSGSSFTLDSFKDLIKGISENESLINIKLKNITISKNKDFDYIETNQWTLNVSLFLLMIESIQNKFHLEQFTMAFLDIPECTFSMNPANVEKYLKDLRSFLTDKDRLKVFNFPFPVPQSFLIEYSEIVLEFIGKSQAIEIFNYFNIKEIRSDTCKAIKYSYFYTNRKDLDKKLEFTQVINSYGYLGTVSSMMPIIISELVKHKPRFELVTPFHTIKSSDYFENREFKLNFRLQNFDPTQVTFLFNCLSSYTNIQVLELLHLKLFQSDISILSKTLPSLTALKSIKVTSVDGPFSHFFLAPNLESMTISQMCIHLAEIKEYEKIISKSKITELKLKKILKDKIPGEAFDTSHSIETNFNYSHNSFDYFLKKFPVNNIKHLKISTSDLFSVVRVFFNNIKLFNSLEFLDFRFPTYRNSLPEIKILIDLLIDPGEPLKSLKLHKYIWNFKKINKSAGRFKVPSLNLDKIDLVLLNQLVERKLCLQA